MAELVLCATTQQRNTRQHAPGYSLLHSSEVLPEVRHVYLLPHPHPPRPPQTNKAMVEVLSNIESSTDLQENLGDPAAMEVLHADRQVAASVTKLVGGSLARWASAAVVL
jgi:hypothetical protein